MARAFPGFDAGPTRLIPLPEAFFTQVLPQLDDEHALRLALYFFWRLALQEDEPRYLTWDEVRDDPYWSFLGDAETRAEVLRAGLEKLVEAGLVLRTRLETQPPIEVLVLNTPKGRALMDALRAGRWRPQAGPRPVQVYLNRPSVFRVYEANFGPLTPLIADRIRAALETYPQAWIYEAMDEAVARNIRRWRYVEAILERWRTEGRHDRTAEGRAPQDDASRYDRSRYAQFYE
ncbi:MAG: DnaD domain protein [Chloroflexi bacterium]|nr:DnaD domain protein [Chloroflexota bacterium]